MKKYLLLLIGAILIVFGSKAQTNITTHFTTNTTLTVANSPYTVTADININAGVTVTVEDGVEIRFNNSRYLQVFGTLNATGTKFTSSSATPTKGIWDGIYVSLNMHRIFGAEKVLLP